MYKRQEKWYEKISIRYTGRLTNSIQTKDNLLFKSNLIKDWKNGMKQDVYQRQAFYLWAVALAIVSGQTVRSLANSDAPVFVEVLRCV